MSKGIICDNCGSSLALDDRGDDENGENAAWVTIGTTYQRFDACTISCAAALLDGPVREAAEAALEAVVAVVRAIRGDEEDD
jgi:hypothetical protein